MPSLPRVPPNEGGRGRPFKTTHTISLFLPEQDKTLWEDFQSAMRRDGWTASTILREWMRQYLKDHPLGNPQTPLERFGEKEVCEHFFDWVHIPRTGYSRYACVTCGKRGELQSG